jgi:uncharacterized protein YdhG (YjbR/CyaY superfamily)
MTVDEYISKIPNDRIEVFNEILKVIRLGLPQGFEECISYGMIGFVVPHSLYPKGYHCDPKLPLPFLSIASQKNSINIYHMGIYADTNLLNWFVESYKENVKGKLDMGKSCIRFKPTQEIPYKLIEELCAKTSVNQWIELYEKSFSK